MNNERRKLFTTENTYRTHVSSKKHKDNELRLAREKARALRDATTDEEADGGREIHLDAPPQPEKDSAESTDMARPNSEDDEVVQSIDEKIAAARSRLSPQHCLFCNEIAPSLTENLEHMSLKHSFFVPDTEYLTDLTGLILYLGEKVAVENICLYCNRKSREFRTLDAVRKHMIDKSHCKIAYDTEKDRLEISDYYDFSSSYAAVPKKKSHKRANKKVEDEEWEDLDDEGQVVDEVIDESASSVPSSDEEADDDDDASSVEDTELKFGDSPYELVLPSGARIGHRTMKRYYDQSFPRLSLAARKALQDDPKSGAALVRRLLSDKNSQLVPRKGGYGAFGSGTDVVKARNRGEAREAGRHVREFRDQKRREAFKTKIAYINNNQKHFRDPLLQVRVVFSLLIDEFAHADYFLSDYIAAGVKLH